MKLTGTTNNSTLVVALSYFKMFTENSIRTNIYGRIVVTFHNATHMLYFETFRFVYKEFFFKFLKVCQDCIEAWNGLPSKSLQRW